ncbi:dedicator of cytokinesis protein 4 [Platysternon megacephalum]|uniref:Dedicator of cytokinesis protein 4 n=1 Tax=Platysternon megacephalum TaxID=55544 RepID=A0A4D9EGA6_9SAUR|nr:dedicator of cytokinesis protein 4 [Platysternon megacephalum]
MQKGQRRFTRFFQTCDIGGDNPINGSIASGQVFLESIPVKLNSQRVTECELLKTEIRDLQEQLKTLKATVSKIQKAWIFINGNSAGEKTFQANGSEGDFETSKATCSQAGGLLASPRNSAENSAIQQIVVRHNKAAYIGINDIQTEGSFKYLSGEAIGYSNWAAGEPNNVGGIEDCIEVYPDGRWNDKSCNEKRLIICEF